MPTCWTETDKGRFLDIFNVEFPRQLPLFWWQLTRLHLWRVSMTSFRADRLLLVHFVSTSQQRLLPINDVYYSLVVICCRFQSLFWQLIDIIHSQIVTATLNGLKNWFEMMHCPASRLICIWWSSLRNNLKKKSSQERKKGDLLIREQMSRNVLSLAGKMRWNKRRTYRISPMSTFFSRSRTAHWLSRRHRSISSAFRQLIEAGFFFFVICLIGK